MMGVQEFAPAEAVSNEISVVLRFDTRSLQVDTIQPANDDVVNYNHHIGHFRVPVLCFIILCHD